MRDNKRRYVESGGTSKPIGTKDLSCPFCKSENLETVEVVLMDCGHSNFVMACHDCGGAFAISNGTHGDLD